MRKSSLISTLVPFCIGFKEGRRLQLTRSTSLTPSTPLITEAQQRCPSLCISVAQRSNWHHGHAARQAAHAVPRAEVAISSSGSALTGQGVITSPTEQAQDMNSEWQRCNSYGTRAIAPCKPSCHEIIVGLTGILPVKIAWHGIVLTARSCQKNTGHIMAENGEIIAQCFNSTIGKSATQADEAGAIVLWSSLASSISLALPAAQASTERFDPHVFLWRAEGSAKLLTTGYVVMDFQYTTVNFVPR